jgi:hypothetical protein
VTGSHGARWRVKRAPHQGDRQESWVAVGADLSGPNRLAIIERSPLTSVTMAAALFPRAVELVWANVGFWQILLI